MIIAVLVAVFGKKKATEIARDVGEVRKEIERVGQESQQAIAELKKPISLTGPEPAAEKPAEEIKPEEVESKEKGGDHQSA